MTNTAAVRQPPPLPTTVGQPMISRDSSLSLVEQIVRTLAARIDDRLLRSGARMPSIRQFADQHGVSRFTVIEAYDRLVASGHLESRRGSGFYVRERAPLLNAAQPDADAANSQLDVVWLVRNMFRQLPPQKMPGSGLLPTEWLDAELVGNAMRAVSRQNPALLLQYGSPQGFMPLRQQLQLKLGELEIQATPEQIVTTSGVTQALDLVARHFLRPGDTVFVDDPAWFLMFGSFAALGARVIGIPRASDGPDVAKLAELAALHRPKLFVTNSVLHNPTSGSLSSAKAFQILKIAEQYDFHIAEDDIYCDLHPGSAIQPAARIAALDQLQRVIYLGGFSKTLAANLRVGFIAASPALAQALADRKILTSLTSTEIGERVVYKVLSEGHYRKHAERLRGKLDRAREHTLRQLERIGLEVTGRPAAGMFVWVDTGRDTNRQTERAMAEGWLLAPGSLFSPHQLPSSKMRLNIAAMSDPGIWRFLEESLEKP
ncbi:PLP-dependent aminotransferase family protein [Janthinobacterium sp. 17J80-10]|uniref:aminotransferase-like domain-containing protein n=1 Tax=Janthinobacterium sp. 17J80-10 TaxID=2497863 RepID=UPI0010056AF0|nr:PLP-dependent aminotransferase family protein [Janthinobacterium sp. 17J80-10]QAU33904.1 PLP-dependent aminotransferase family protein [Janthinobacterium sp. 17J80-10]